jgi:predicted  nucleic acid-binding Zn-ribbon protein
MNKVYCSACGIEIPKAVLQKNPNNYWSEFLDWCPNCGIISMHEKFFSRIEKIHKDLKEVLGEIKKIKENAKCECGGTGSPKPLKIIFDLTDKP